MLPASLEESDFVPPEGPVGFFGGSPVINRAPRKSHSGGRSAASSKVINAYDRIFAPAEINHEAQTFTTRTFLIRHRQDEVRGDDLVSNCSEQIN